MHCCRALSQAPCCRRRVAGAVWQGRTSHGSAVHCCSALPSIAGDRRGSSLPCIVAVHCCRALLQRMHCCSDGVYRAAVHCAQYIAAVHCCRALLQRIVARHRCGKAVQRIAVLCITAVHCRALLGIWVVPIPPPVRRCRSNAPWCCCSVVLLQLTCAVAIDRTHRCCMLLSAVQRALLCTATRYIPVNCIAVQYIAGHRVGAGRCGAAHVLYDLAA